MKKLFWLGLLFSACQIEVGPKPVEKIKVAPVPSSNRVESSTASINLAWNRNTEPNIAGYKVYYGEASHLYSETQDAGNEVTATVANLMIGTTYYFAVSAYDTNTFESAFSNEISQVAGAGASPSPTIEPSPTATSTPVATISPPPSPTATPTATSTPTATIAPATGKLVNISTRGFVQSGDNALIAGFVILDSEKRVMIRAIGPSLSVYFPQVLANPILELRNAFGELIGGNDNWRSSQEAEIIATGLAPTNNLESAYVRSLLPGSYTVIVRGVNNGTGVALVEVYALE